ncbi:GtrA family protein [Methanoregula sp. UBA64]|uniref:GtrA family protein n=1 Tax=Methanoregula sp. UBA64 TaxID=1915554 RepID=UPI0025D0DF5C|nr:GtrA family protein [Methanoregula sp. UBA64]
MVQILAKKIPPRLPLGTLISFLQVGIIASLVDLGLLYVFTEYFGIWYLLSAAASYICGMIVSYTLNKRFTFHNVNKQYIWQFFLFAIVSTSGLIVNISVMFFAVTFFSIYYLYAKVISMCITFFWNYSFQSRITFQV